MKRGRIVVAAAALTLGVAGGAAAWGAAGHAMIGAAAVAGLPSTMPAFFMSAADQLSWLNPEPDRWRSSDLVLMDEAFKYDHYIDLENVPAGALDAPDRWEYLEALYASGLDEPEQSAGFLPWRILELQERLTTGFARWRVAGSERERRWIEQRILNDAGVLGHYVADASQPHHTTIHYNGWAEGAPNPRRYTTERDFHGRFESGFVEAHVAPAEVMRAVPDGVEPIGDVRRAVMDYIRETHDRVVPLYELEKQYGFSPDEAPAAAEERFTVDRLARAASMLRSLWYTAWIDSQAVDTSWY
jgi:hypothetical protein